ncbi:hypothetical protein C8F04DRAFT_1230752 [Mycena alexandri]|uniref:Uncharacterized protein n=1 Tax=Mycena alexandri TaxID=1745969 RepID=A0AAD6TB67_9AGAR|nr:hypothetical protein C8F04DRAFT_1230752 [Mycena alexandri]
MEGDSAPPSNTLSSVPISLGVSRLNLFMPNRSGRLACPRARFAWCEHQCLYPLYSPPIFSSMSTLEAEFPLYWNSMVSHLYKASLSLLLHGMFVVLFILAVHILSRRKTTSRRTLLVATWLMFCVGNMRLALDVLATAVSVRIVQDNIQSSANLIAQLRLLFTLQSVQTGFFALNVLVADILFLYRCYVIWGCQKRVLILPGMFIAATIAASVRYFATGGSSGLVTASSEPSFSAKLPYILGALTNLVITSFIVGKVCWIRRDAHIVGVYDVVLTILLESGALYCLSAILMAIFGTPSPSFVAGAIFDAIAVEGVNILPMLMVVRMGLGYNGQDTNEPR